MVRMHLLGAEQHAVVPQRTDAAQVTDICARILLASRQVLCVNEGLKMGKGKIGKHT